MFPVISAVSILCLQPSVSHSYLEPPREIRHSANQKCKVRTSEHTRAMIFIEISVDHLNLT